jgi:hypothetical protein
LRKKTLIAAAVAIALPAAGTLAIAQTVEPDAVMTMSVDPTNAGSRLKPKPTQIELSVQNSDTSQTASVLELYFNNRFRVSGKGLPKCDLDALSEAGPDGCPDSSSAGGGHATARAGVNKSTNPPELPFIVSAFITGEKSIAFYLQQENGSIQAVAPAKIKDAAGAKWGKKLVISIPEEPAQQYPAGNYNGLETIEATLSAQKGKKALFRTTGCKGGEHKFKAVLHFVPNPGPPKVEQVKTTTSAPCQK